ncbi:MAG: carboxypeptidase-like regulatory domain-containing protein [Armatimonadia bacterium]
MRTIILVLLSLTPLTTANAAEETLSGLVLGPDGQPAAGATVVAMKYVAKVGGSAVELTTDAEGRFSYEYQIVARPKAQGPGWGGRLVGQFTAEGGETEQDAGVFEFEVPDGQ